MSQAELAERAGVSRQLVSSVEAGRHLPRVDAAISLARALAVEVAELFATETGPSDVLSGSTPPEGALVRVGLVGDLQVVTSAGVDSAGWNSADAVIESGRVRRFASLAPGPVMVGCEPGLEIIEQDLREARRGAVAVTASTRSARSALEAGRAHLAVIHGTAEDLPAPSQGIQRIRLCSWRVGLAAPEDAQKGWPLAALDGAIPVIQRESGAGVQAAFERASNGPVAGPHSTGHIEAVKMALVTGMPAVTIEPAAIALGASFHALETHDAEVWVSGQFTGDPAVEAVVDEISSERFQSVLAAIGGYDLGRIGSRAA